MKNKDFEEIYKKYHKNLLVYALSLCGDYQLAQSLVQATFTKAYLSYREGGSLKFWLSKVLKNEFINHIRSKSRYVDDPEIIFQRLSGPDNPLDLLIKEETMREVAHAITLLPKRYRLVLMYSIYMQLKDEEIADIMATSPSNVRKIRSRARQRLKEIMIERKWGD
nr:sigma-70 family RNA polymerase sigma factor [uncultured Peptostreptococcus sp.]